MHRFLLLFMTILFGVSFVQAGNTPRALWITVSSPNHDNVKIAVTEPIARLFLERSDSCFNLNGHGRHGKVTREMLLDVLNGKTTTIHVEDPEDGTETTITMGRLEIPRRMGNDRHVTMEVRKDGKRTFRMSLGDINIEKGEEGEDDEDVDMDVKGDFEWRALLPVLRKEGGAIYINNEDEATEVWLVAG